MDRASNCLSIVDMKRQRPEGRDSLSAAFLCAGCSCFSSGCVFEIIVSSRIFELSQRGSNLHERCIVVGKVTFWCLPLYFNAEALFDRN